MTPSLVDLPADTRSMNRETTLARNVAYMALVFGVSGFVALAVVQFITPTQVTVITRSAAMYAIALGVVAALTTAGLARVSRVQERRTKLVVQDSMS